MPPWSRRSRLLHFSRSPFNRRFHPSPPDHSHPGPVGNHHHHHHPCPVHPTHRTLSTPSTSTATWSPRLQALRIGNMVPERARPTAFRSRALPTPAMRSAPAKTYNHEDAPEPPGGRCRGELGLQGGGGDFFAAPSLGALPECEPVQVRKKSAGWGRYVQAGNRGGQIGHEDCPRPEEKDPIALAWVKLRSETQGKAQHLRTECRAPPSPSTTSYTSTRSIVLSSLDQCLDALATSLQPEMLISDAFNVILSVGPKCWPAGQNPDLFKNRVANPGLNPSRGPRGCAQRSNTEKMKAALDKFD